MELDAFSDDHSLVIATANPALRLIELSERDLDAYYALIDANRKHLTRHGDYASMKTATRESTRLALREHNGVDLRMGVWLADRLAGRIDLLPKEPGKSGIGYWLSDAFTGRGYATLACRAIIDYGRDVLGIEEVYAGVTKGNAASEAVLHRVGFQLIADMGTYNRFMLKTADAD
jgi:ribosomal-protein-serine acetyltransferase